MVSLAVNKYFAVYWFTLASGYWIVIALMLVQIFCEFVRDNFDQIDQHQYFNYVSNFVFQLRVAGLIIRVVTVDFSN